MIPKIDIVSQRLIAISASVLLLAIAFNLLCNKSSIKIKGLGVNIERAADEIKERVTYERIEVNFLDSILKTGSVPKIIKDSIEYWRHSRQIDINNAEELLDEFKNASNYDDNEKENLLNKFMDYLSLKVNPSASIDYKSKARHLLYSNEQERKNRENIAVINKEKSDLEHENINVKNENILLQKEKDSLSQIYTLKIKILEGKVKSYLVDSIGNADQIRNARDSIKLYKDKSSELFEREKNYKKLSVLKSTFFIPICRQRKDGTYPLSCAKILQLKFTLEYTNLNEKSKYETIKFKFIIPSDEVGLVHTPEFERRAEVGKDTIFEFKPSEFKIEHFYRGQYSIEVYHEESSKIRAIYRSYLRIK